MQLPADIDADVFNKIWLFLLLACIGADFEHEDYESITGVYLSVRLRGSKIQIWCRASPIKQGSVGGKGIEKKLKELLEEQQLKNSKPTFTSFAQCVDSYKKTSKKGKEPYQVRTEQKK